jgi:hypothetical protein
VLDLVEGSLPQVSCNNSLSIFRSLLDIITGALALPLIAFMSRTHGGNSVIPQAWNWFGTIDLLVAVALGVMSADSSPLQVFRTGIKRPLPVQGLPWSLIPTVLVPLYLILQHYACAIAQEGGIRFGSASRRRGIGLAFGTMIFTRATARC